jgi:broad specificity phosphatase PhoE
MSTRHSSRDDAPAYLMRYEQRRRSALARQAAEAEDAADFVVRARNRATERALEELARPEAPPDGHTVAYARDTVAPREIQYPESFRSRLAGSTDVRLIRHGQTQGYITDGGLTPLGHWQAHRKGQDLAKGLAAGQTVRIVHANTARAYETALAVHEGVLQAVGRYGISGAIIEEPVIDEAFNNFQAYVDGREMDVTAAFQEYASFRERHAASGAGDRPGWMAEMDRFWLIQAAGGDPISHWISQPMQYVETPVLTVRRWWRGIVRAIQDGPPNMRLFVCSHSGPIRAMATQAVGHDPGEPNNVEDVRIRVYADLEHAIVTYRGRGTEIEIPTTVSPSWFQRGDG